MDPVLLKRLVEFSKTPVAQKISRKGVDLIAKALRRKSTARKAYNMYQKVLLEQTGEPSNTSNAKGTRVRSNGELQFLTNTLNGFNCLQIDRRNTTSYLLNQRERDVIYLSGFKLCIGFRNNLNDAASFPLYFNIALVSTKNKTGVSDIDFFRQYSGTGRSKNFDDPALTALDRHCMPINSDNYLVHWHYRTYCTPFQNVPADQNQKPDAWEMHKWIPIKRQIRFDSADGTSAETQFYIVHWAGRPGDSEVASLAVNAIADAYRMEYSCHIVFREPEAVMRMPKRY